MTRFGSSRRSGFVPVLTAASVLFAGAAHLQAQNATREVGTVPGPPQAFRPMTKSERLNDYLKKLANPVSVVSSSASAGIGQWRDSPDEWGQGGEGFGRRFASSFAQHIVTETLLFGVSTALHEDNRYALSADRSTRGRILNAIKGTFFARRDDGGMRFSYSRIGAYGGAAIISRSWQPEDSHKVRGAFYSVSSSIGMSIGMNVVREFWPRRR